MRNALPARVVLFIGFTLLAGLAGPLYAALWPEAPLSAGDTLSYVNVAADLQDGVLDELHVRTVGYPLLLLLTDSLTPTRRLFITQLGLYFISVFLLTWYLLSAKVSKRWVVLFLLLALLPPNVAGAAYMLTETFATFLLVAGAVSLLLWLERTNPWMLLIAGTALALVAFVRPTYQLLFIGLAAALVIFAVFLEKKRRELLLAAAGVFVVSLALIGGYSIFNTTRFGFSGLSPMLGLNLSTKTVRVVERLPDSDRELREILVRYRDQALVESNSSHIGGMYIWDAAPELQRLTGLDTAALSRLMLSKNLYLIRAAPLEYLQEVTRSLSTYWFPSSSDISNFDSRMIQLLWIVVHFVTFILFGWVTLLITSAVLLTWWLPNDAADKLRQQARPLEHFLLPFSVSLVIIVYTMLVSTLLEVGNAEYRVPTDLLIFFSLAIGVHGLFKLRHGHNQSVFDGHARDGNETQN